MLELTRAEFMEKHGDVKVKFKSYYKYTFTYVGVTENGNRIVVGYGGDSAEIYRHELYADDTETIDYLQPYQGFVYKDGEMIESFYEF